MGRAIGEGLWVHILTMIRAFLMINLDGLYSERHTNIFTLQHSIR